MTIKNIFSVLLLFFCKMTLAYAVTSDSLLMIHGDKVKMVVFTTYEGYKPSDTKMDATIWTTVSPEVKTRCAEYKKKYHPTAYQLNLWIAELLGLPPQEVEKRRFVEIEVPVIQAYYGIPAKKIGIFRPCTDPRISEHPDHTPVCPAHINSSNKYISSRFRSWFHASHRGLWTERGYTYNWNREAKSRVGVSEFVVLKGTPVRVVVNPDGMNTVYRRAEEYCRH